MKAICPLCEKSRTVKWKPKKGVVCKDCRNSKKRINPLGERTKYQRVCECGDVAYVGYKPKGTEMCRSCRGKEQAINMCGKNVKKPEDRIRYTHICMMCPSVRVTLDKRKSNLCIDCSRKHSRKKKPKIYFDFKDMKIKATKRYFVFVKNGKDTNHCDVCDTTREVSQSQFSQYGFHTNCRKHAKRKKKNTKSTKQAKKEVSKEAIEKQREINKKHREEVQNVSKIAKSKLTDEQMMSKFMKKNSVTVIPDAVKMSDLGIGSKTGFCRAD